jgi:hypothetical protein
LPFKGLDIDEAEYEKFFNPLDNTTYYTDRERGVSIAVSGGLVGEFRYSRLRRMNTSAALPR